MEQRIRLHIAASLHDLARILGTEITDSDIIPAFDLLLKDQG